MTAIAIAGAAQEEKESMERIWQRARKLQSSAKRQITSLAKISASDPTIQRMMADASNVVAGVSQILETETSVAAAERALTRMETLMIRSRGKAQL
jgi:hypothetical protein